LSDTAPSPSIAAIGGGIGGLICRHIDLAFRRIMPGPGVDVEAGFVRLVTGEPHPFGNFACMSHPADVAGTEAAMKPLLACGAPAAVFFTGGVPGEVVERLGAAGFARHGGLPAMAVEIEKLPGTGLPNGYTFSRVSDRGEREKWAEVFARGYGLPLRVGSAFSGGIDGDGRSDAPVQYFWILKDGKPVCTSLLYLHEGVAGIYGVATVPEERGKGLGAFVTAEPLRIAHRLRYCVGVLQASEDGHPVYRRLGFADFGEVPLYVRMPQ
jgi:GNAT superfamily N-acetyltransferase